MHRALMAMAFACLTAAAQIPPPILRVIRNPSISRDAPMRPYVTASAAIEVLGMRATTGLPETWLIEQHPTFASIEELDKAILGSFGEGWPQAVEPPAGQQDETLGPSRVLIAFYREGWGYHSEDAIRMLPRARYFYVTIYRMRPDSDQEMENLMRQRHQRLDAMNLNQADLVYHVISGGSSGLYLVLAPMTSLRTMDDRLTKMPLEMEPKQAPGSELGRESLLFRIDPQLSYVSDDFAAVDKAFWRGR